MGDKKQPELDWNQRIPVWACDHLWATAERGDKQARGEIAEAASDFATDLGENVALCPACDALEQHITMTYRWVNTLWLDGNHQTLVDVGDSKDGPALPAFELR